MKWVRVCKSPEETKALGAVLGRCSAGGEVICLQGELGAGKTIFTQGIAQGLGVAGLVNSPTFNLVSEYMGRIPLFHMDLYRLDNPEMLFDIGFEEYVSGNGVTVIEWAEKAGPYIPEERLWIDISKGPADEPEGCYFRILNLDASGDCHRKLLKGMMNDAGSGA